MLQSMPRLALLLCLALPALALAEPPTVAVLYFDYDGQAEDLRVLRKGLAQMLITDLGGCELKVVERARLQEVVEELKLGQSGKVDAATAAKVGKLLGARYLVMGGYFELGGQLVVNARAVQTETAAAVGTARARGKPEDFYELEQKLAADLCASLARLPPPPKPAHDSQPDRKLPAKAAVRYSKALDAIDRKDTATARRELEAVVKEQPGFALAATDLANLVR